eukprot:Skav234222  [mRNA]  locus=scaffold1464:117070:134785:+ [translate_table: standard]
MLEQAPRLLQLAWPSVGSLILDQDGMLPSKHHFCLGMGVNSALNTLVSQSKGMLLMWNAGMLFQAVGINQRTAEDAGEFVRGTIFVVPFHFLACATRSFLRAMQLPRPILCVNLVVVTFHALWCYLRSPSDCDDGPSFATYLRVALPSAVLMWAEWWAYEIMSLLAGEASNLWGSQQLTPVLFANCCPWLSEGLSAGLAGYDHGAASGALQNLVALKGQGLKRQRRFGPLLQGWVVASAWVSNIVGNLSGYYLPTPRIVQLVKISKALIVAGLLEMVGSLLTGFAPTLWVLILGRGAIAVQETTFVSGAFIGALVGSVLSTLWEEGGIRRLYQGVQLAVIQAPLSRLGDTAANAGVLVLMDFYFPDAPLPLKTAVASTAAASWRLFLTPIDTLKTTYQAGKVKSVAHLSNIGEACDWK